MCRLLHAKIEPGGWGLTASFTKNIRLDYQLVTESSQIKLSHWGTIEVDSAHCRSGYNSFLEIKSQKFQNEPRRKTLNVHQNERFQHDFTLHLIVTLKEELTNNFHKRLVVLQWCNSTTKKVSLKSELQSRQTFKFKPTQYSRLPRQERSATISKFRTSSSLVLHIDVLLRKVWHFVIVSWIST